MKKTVEVPDGIRIFSIGIYALACIYNFCWVTLFVIKPSFFQAYYPFAIDTYPLVFTSLKTIVVLLGLGYLMASFFPNRLWWLAPFSIFAKTFGAILAFVLIKAGLIYPTFYWQVFFNDLIWLPPIGFMAYQYFKAWQNTATINGNTFPEILNEYSTQYGSTLEEIQEKTPVLLVFLRHFGCTFCKETLGDLANQRASIENEHGAQIVFVHMADEKYASEYFAAYHLKDASRISDPTCQLYQTFELKRAGFKQVFGIKSWLRGANALFTKGHGIGKLVGDGFRMPGVFLIYKKEILQGYRHRTASDIPPYQELASCPVV